MSDFRPCKCEWPYPTGHVRQTRYYSGSAGDSVYSKAFCGQESETEDPVNSPEHYRWLPVEVIEITEHFNFRLGNALKYIMRADHKGKPIEDLKKARWYLDREISRRLASEETQ